MGAVMRQNQMALYISCLFGTVCSKKFQRIIRKSAQFSSISKRYLPLPGNTLLNVVEAITNDGFKIKIEIID